MKTLFFVFVFFILSTFLAATIINVPGDQPTIQEGINVAVDTDTVLVQPGTYYELIDYNGKNITLTSLFLTTQDTTYISQTIINGWQVSVIVTFENGEGETAILIGFTITNGFAEYGGGIYCDNSSPSLENVTLANNYAMYGGGIHCQNYSSPSLENVIIVDNHALGFGGGIYCDSNSSPTLENVTIVDNSAFDGGGMHCVSNCSPNLINVTMANNFAVFGGGIYCNNSSPSLVNCIMWNDTPEEVYFNEYSPLNTITIAYSDIEGGIGAIVTNNNGTVNWLQGNIDEDPLFVDPENDDYHLTENSPCIDAGNPDPLYYDPEDPNNPGFALYPAMGTIINDMGAYGGPNAIGWPVVGLDDNIIIQTPEVLLHQNYPNPFKPTTTINYYLKENSKVELNIYNIKGQKVQILVNEVLPAGEHSIIWNGRDSNGNRVGSGIYFYRLEAGDYQKVSKMVLIK